MIPAEVIKNIRRIQIKTSHMVTDVFAGHYQSVFKGRGMEFDAVREYQIGDDIRSIDWNVTARLGHPFIKKFVEERELTVMLLLDRSPSCHFGTINQLKSELAAEICSLLAFSAIKNNDNVGLILFTDGIERFVPPRKGLRHVLRVVREALYHTVKGEGTDISQTIDYLNRITNRRTVSFIISDFYSEDFIKSFSVANKRHDIIAVTITDPVEINLPDVGIIELTDPETGENFLIDTSDSLIRKEYHTKSLNRIEERKNSFRSINIDHIDIRTDIPYLKSLISFFRMRERRIH